MPFHVSLGFLPNMEHVAGFNACAGRIFDAIEESGRLVPGESHDIASMNTFIGWGAPPVFDFYIKGQLPNSTFPIGVGVQGGYYGRDIGSQLQFGTFPVLSQVANQGDQCSQRQSGLCNHNDEHPKGPIGHFLLRYNISPFALIPFLLVGVALLYAGFFKLIDYAIERQNYRWAIVAWCSALTGAFLFAFATTGWLSL